MKKKIYIIVFLGVVLLLLLDVLLCMFFPINLFEKVANFSESKIAELRSLKSFPNKGDILCKRKGSMYASHTIIYGFVDVDKMLKFADQNNLTYETAAYPEDYEVDIPSEFGKTHPILLLGRKVLLIENKSNDSLAIRIVVSQETGEFVGTIPVGILR